LHELVSDPFGGNIAYILLTASMLWGLLLIVKPLRQTLSSPMSLLLHATVSWLAVVFALGHALLLLIDTYFSYTLASILIPFLGEYRPLWVGLGVIAFWLLLVVNISFNIRRRIGNRAWRWLHYTSYGAFVLVTLHTLFAGTDAGLFGMKVLLGASVAGVALLFLWRVGPSRRMA